MTTAPISECQELGEAMCILQQRLKFGNEEKVGEEGTQIIAHGNCGCFNTESSGP